MAQPIIVHLDSSSGQDTADLQVEMPAQDGEFGQWRTLDSQALATLGGICVVLAEEVELQAPELAGLVLSNFPASQYGRGMKRYAEGSLPKGEFTWTRVDS